MKKQYIDPEMIIETYGDDIACTGFGWDSFENGGYAIIDELEDM